MKSRHVTMVFGVVVALLFLQPACAGVKERRGEEAAAVEEAPAAVEGAVKAEGQLAAAHESSGISCGDCHAESPPAIAVTEATCLTCHEDYRDLTAGLYADPHNAHIMFQDCGDCHHAHQPSENQCLACHAF